MSVSEDVEMSDASFRLRPFQIVVALCDDNGIGREGKLPWAIEADMKHFRKLTSVVHDPSKHNAVIMGRKTWESIPQNFRPLKNRLNIVLTRQPRDLSSVVIQSPSLEAALQTLSEPPLNSSVENVFVIGGSEVYREALLDKNCAVLHVTKIEGIFECDRHFPAIPESFRVYAATSPIRDPASKTRYAFLVYRQKGYENFNLPAATAAKHEEFQVCIFVYDEKTVFSIWML